MDNADKEGRRRALEWKQQQGVLAAPKPAGLPYDPLSFPELSDGAAEYWAKANSWTGEEAIDLLCGLDPAPGKSKLTFGHPIAGQLEAKKQQLLLLMGRAIEAGKLTDLSPNSLLAWAENYEIPVPANLKAAVERRHGIIKTWSARHEEQAKQIAELQEQLRRVLERYEANIRALSDAWQQALLQSQENAKAERDAIISLMAKQMEAAEAERDSLRAEVARLQAEGRRWPWGSYTTPLLEALAGAAEKFWARYDPADPSTAPRSEDVERWLKEEPRKVGSRNATIMATILRDPNLKPGPR